jgi:hypothetical protein
MQHLTRLFLSPNQRGLPAYARHMAQLATSRDLDSVWHFGLELGAMLRSFFPLWVLK